MKQMLLLILLVALGCNTALANIDTKTSGYKYANRWSKIFIKQNERIESVELVFEGDAVAAKRGFKPEVFIKVNDGKNGYRVGFFYGRIIHEKSEKFYHNQDSWRNHSSTTYQEAISVDDLRAKESIVFEDASYLDLNQPIFNDTGELIQDMLDVNSPNTCFWPFNYRPISRLLWLYDFQEFKDRYKWQKYVIFRYPNKTKIYLSPKLENNQEPELDKYNATFLMEDRYETETKINSILDLKDGTILVVGERFVVRLKVNDGRMQLANPYVRVVDAKEISEYLNQLDDFYRKNQINNSRHFETNSSSFQEAYYRYADELVYKKWFKK